jgi:hypothetical protein
MQTLTRSFSLSSTLRSPSLFSALARFLSFFCRGNPPRTRTGTNPSASSLEAEDSEPGLIRFATSVGAAKAMGDETEDEDTSLIDVDEEELVLRVLVVTDEVAVRVAREGIEVEEPNLEVDATAEEVEVRAIAGRAVAIADEAEANVDCRVLVLVSFSESDESELLPRPSSELGERKSSS